jgi:hypothetical protein
MLGGDHSIGFPCVRGIANVTSKRIGIIHFDRHIDIQEKDLDERMHTTPWYWATNLPNVSATNLVQLGIGGWQVPRYGVAGILAVSSLRLLAKGSRPGDLLDGSLASSRPRQRPSPQA